MRRCVAYGLIAGLVAVALTGCGFFDTEEREPWRAQEEARCLASGAVVPSAYIRKDKELKGPRICGLEYPYKVSALISGTVPLSKGLTLSCSMIPAMENWIREKIQPAAYMHFGMPITELKVMGSYGCRTMNHKKGANWSEHAFANAVDVSGFTLLDGRVIDVKKHWKSGAPNERAFLRDVHGGACDYFRTVLGPGSDAYHYDHFHVDLRMHDPRGNRRICKPVPQVTPSPYRNTEQPTARAPQPQAYPRTAVAQAPAPYPAPSLPPASYPQGAAYPQQPYPADPYAQTLAAAPPVRQGPMSVADDPIGMWIQQSAPYAVPPVTIPQAVFPQAGTTGLY